MALANTKSNGEYSLALVSGNYFVTTDNGQGNQDEVYHDLPCPDGSAFVGLCDPTSGTPVAAWPASGGIDFVLRGPRIFADDFESGYTAPWTIRSTHR